ncbi:MAG: response regulator transcription factor [Anaerolineae bacterium]|nr:response regulator transcription factor [Gemmatimonadaceae bacterium]
MNAVKSVRVLIVDDEPLARERLRTLLADREGFKLLAECADGEEAVAAINEHEPDLVFLDVQMPELDGFGVLEVLSDDLGKRELPVVVFVTAFDDYALRAFDVNAVDYLLKPFDRTRFETALARATDRIGRQNDADSHDAGHQATDTDPHSELRALIEQLRAEREAYVAATPSTAPRFVVRSGGKLHFVRADDVDWIDAEGNYVRLHVGGRSHLVRDRMKAVEAKLNPAKYVRVHRSAIVNVDRIASLEPYFHGEYVLTMKDGAKLTSSRSYSARLRELLG